LAGVSAKLENAVSGKFLTVLFAFNNQGIELENPNKNMDAERSGTESYFSELGGFSKVIPGMASTKRA
jgi:hypothetical protein